MTHPAEEANPNVKREIIEHLEIDFATDLGQDRYSGEKVTIPIGSLVMYKKTGTVWKVVAREQGGRVKICYRGANRKLKAFNKSLRLLKFSATREDTENLEIPESRWGYDV